MLPSVVDQKAKQRLQFFGAVTIGNFDGQLFVASASTVYKIKPVSIPLQIQVNKLSLSSLTNKMFRTIFYSVVPS